MERRNEEPLGVAAWYWGWGEFASFPPRPPTSGIAEALGPGWVGTVEAWGVGAGQGTVQISPSPSP